MSYILEQDGTSKLLDANYIILPQENSLYALVKNGNEVNLEEVLISDFISNQSENDCLIFYDSKTKKIKTITIPETIANYLIKRTNDNSVILSKFSGEVTTGTPLENHMIVCNSEFYRPLQEYNEENTITSSGEYLIHTTVSLYNEDICFLDSFEEEVPLKYYLTIKAGETVLFDTFLLDSSNPLISINQSRLVTLHEDNTKITFETNYDKLAMLPNLDSVIIIFQKLS